MAATRLLNFCKNFTRSLSAVRLPKAVPEQFLFSSQTPVHQPSFQRLFSGSCLYSRIVIPQHFRQPCTVTQQRHITLLTTFNVVDNSALGQRTKRNRKPYLIGFYRKRKTADIGDVIRVAVGGKTNKAIVVGTRKTKHHTVPRYDNNNIVLVDDNLAPLGTRIKGPIPSIIRRRQAKYSKVLAIASRFI
ncbi:39S ribosomal protein L14, mitochondrial-like [Actinia tenebrosa]|uniref:Large ribosomal subunit protein uL14m n=1 Tax=Actinia tenebrosa TaxID=6105 RepID=A0A6P8J074_ACTTE|nr:39S ribosomal protein L14, mitochondrial-like [Actinia tenebrosa]